MGFCGKVIHMSLCRRAGLRGSSCLLLSPCRQCHGQAQSKTTVNEKCAPSIITSLRMLLIQMQQSCHCHFYVKATNQKVPVYRLIVQINPLTFFPFYFLLSAFKLGNNILFHTVWTVTVSYRLCISLLQLIIEAL